MSYYKPNEKTTIQIDEITQIQQFGYYYITIRFRPFGIKDQTVMEKILFNRVGFSEQYSIQDCEDNSILNWQKHRQAALPISLSPGKSYAVVTVSTDKQLFDPDTICFVFGDDRTYHYAR
ncbi:MAG: hypothetical protein ACI4XL_12680 [Bacillus sp. (in: firmicutes)]